MIRPILVAVLLALSLLSSDVTVTRGIALNPLPGYYTYNVDPTLTSPDRGPIYDPNFIPGFQVGLTNTSITWQNGTGYARIGYSIGPWKHLQVGLPHLAVGPQCCNFQEIPRTQQFRSEDWGDFYYVKAGFLSPGVNIANYTTNFSAPAYVGLRTDWNWVVSVSFDWTTPQLLNSENQWAAIGIAATQYVPSVSTKLVYTVVNFWMDANSSAVLARNPGSTSAYMIGGPHIVVYHAAQLSDIGNQTVTINLSPYLEQTLKVLNFAVSESEPPVISYVYLNIEGYNVQWNSTLYSFFVMSDHSPTSSATADLSTLALYGAMVVVGAVGLFVYVKKRQRPSKP